MIEKFLQKTFQSKESIEIVNNGLQQRELIHWNDRQIIKPFLDAQGVGSRREYIYQNLLEMALANELHKSGHETSQIAEILDRFREGGILKDWMNGFLKERMDWIKEAEPGKQREKIERTGEPIGVYLLYRKGKKTSGRVLYFSLSELWSNIYKFWAVLPDDLKKSNSITIIYLGRLKAEIDARIREKYK